MTSYSPVSRATGVTSRERDRRRVHHHAAEHDQPRDHQGVAAPALGAHEPRQADRAGGAGDVLDRHRPHQPLGLQRLLQRAGRLVPAAARRGGRGDAQLGPWLLRRRPAPATASDVATTADAPRPAAGRAAAPRTRTTACGASRLAERKSARPITPRTIFQASMPKILASAATRATAAAAANPRSGVSHGCTEIFARVQRP